MASRMVLRLYRTDADVVTYWFDDESDWRTGYVAKALGTELSVSHVDPPATAEEIAAWSAAATAYVDEAASALADLHRVDRRTRGWRRRPLVRRWASARLDAATAVCADRLRAAAEVYRPVLDVVEGRIAEQEAVRRREAERARRRRARLWLLAAGRHLVWRRRHDAADTKLPGGRTPRQLAAKALEPTEWPSPGIVGDVDAWWAEVRGSVVNRRARDAAVRRVVKAIKVTCKALDRAGRPGLQVVRQEPSDSVKGWWIEFSWSSLPGVERLRQPPDVPVDHLGSGDWHLGLHLPDRVLLTPGWWGDYEFANVTSTEIGNGRAYRYWWQMRDAKEFANDLLPDRATYFQRYRYDPDHRVVVRMADYADPAAYVPYVEAVAQRVEGVLHALAPG